MTSPNMIPAATYDWNTPITEAQRLEILTDLAKEEADQAEDNQSASRPPFPPEVGVQILRKKLRSHR